MAVATHAQASVDVATVAGEHGARGDDALVQENQALCRLKGRAGRIGGHDGAVIQRLEAVVDQVAVVLTALLADEQRRVVAGAGHQRQDFARLGLDAHDGAHLALHEQFAVGLQADVDAQLQVVASNGRYIVGTVVVVPLDFACGVADKDFLALDAAQPGLVALLDAQVARVVTGTVVVVVLDVAGVDLADVAQDVGGNGVIVLAQDALHDIEARETVQFLLQAAVVLGCEVVHEHLLGEGRVAAAFLHLGPSVLKFINADLQRVAEVDGVKRRHVLGNHHQIILGRVIHHQRVVAVVDEAARRVNHLLHEGVVVGMRLVGAVQHLQLHQADDVDDDDGNDEPADDQFALLQVIVFSHGACSLNCLTQR